MLWRVLLFLTCLSSALSQYTTGRVEGCVVDPTGSGIPGCQLTLTSLDTNQSRTIDTATDGTYIFSAVLPGRYRLNAVKTGFRPQAAELSISTSQTNTQPFRLEVGDQTAAIVVQGESSLLFNAIDPLRQVTRTQLELERLPTARRDVVNVITLAPGVTPTFNPRGGNLTTLSIAQAGQINSNGGRSKATAHQIDYTDANDWEFGGFALATQPTPDMLQEFKILTNNWSAEYGVKSNAEVILITRSGTNSLHGVAYDYLQNAKLNARDYFDRTGNPTPLRQNLFGFAAGGPAWKDKLFLFSSYEGRRTRGAGTTFNANLPTPGARARVTDPSIRSILNLLPLPAASTSNPDVGTSAVLSTSPSNADLFLIRGDYYIRPTNTLTVRYFQNVGTGFNRTAGSLPGFDATFDPKGRNATIADTWVLGPSATNEFRIAYGRSSALFSPETQPATPRFTVPGIAGFGTVQSWPQGRVFNVYQLSDTFSYAWHRHQFKAGVDLRYIQDNSVNDSNRRGIYTFGSLNDFLNGVPSNYTQVFGNTYRGYRTRYPGVFLQDDWRLRPTLNISLGLRWEYQGGLKEANRLQAVLDPSQPGNIGNAGSGLLGTFRSQNPIVQENAGLVAPRVGFAWNPGSGRLVLRGGYGIYYDSFLFNSLQAGRTTPPINYTGSIAGTAISGANSFANLLAGNAAIQQTLNAQLGNFGPLVNLGSIVTTKPTLRNPYAQHFSLGLQYRLPNRWTADLAYVGTRGTALSIYGPANSVAFQNRPAPATSVADEQARLAQFQSFTALTNGTATTRSLRLDPRFNDVSLVTDSGSSTYHSLQLQVAKSFAQGLLVQATYTWSKSIDNGSDYSPGQATTDRNFAQDQFNLRNERGVSTFDIPQRFTLSHVWQIPIFRAQKGIVGHVLGGWTWSSINQMQTGIPFTVVGGPRTVRNPATGANVTFTDANLDGNLSSFDNARANCIAGGTFRLGLPGSQVNTKYAQALLGNNGNCGRNTERLRNLFNYDWSFSKNIHLFERGPLGSGPFGIEYRADLFNIFNNSYLTVTGDNYRIVSDPQFGTLNAAGSTRRIQMALRVLW